MKKVVMRSSSIDEDLGWEIINFMTTEMDTFRLNIPLWKNLICLDWCGHLRNQKVQFAGSNLMYVFFLTFKKLFRVICMHFNTFLYPQVLHGRLNRSTSV